MGLFNDELMKLEKRKCAHFRAAIFKIHLKSGKFLR